MLLLLLLFLLLLASWLAVFGCCLLFLLRGVSGECGSGLEHFVFVLVKFVAPVFVCVCVCVHVFANYYQLCYLLKNVCARMNMDKVKANGDRSRCAAAAIAAPVPIRCRVLVWCNDYFHVTCVQCELDIDGVA